MQCPNCKSEKVHKNGIRNGIQRYKCQECGKEFTGKQERVKPKIGMTLNEFKAKYDTDFIVNDRLTKVMNSLSRNMIYEKVDIVKMSQLPASYPGFRDTLESFKNHQGRANSKTFYSHPDTIAELKQQAKLT